jgi:predicted ATPase/DNA-binding SARP family transcriptional activator
MLTLAVLGPVELRRDGVRLVVPAGRTTEVLVRLALDAGSLVRTDRLIEDLWSDQAKAVTRNTLQAKVSKVRRVLGDPGLVTGSGTGYTLNVDPGCVDALEVLRLAESATRLREAGDDHASARACTTALSMFRGEILPDAGDGDWVAPCRARLDEARLRLSEDGLGARIDLGASGELVGELEDLVRAHPLREGLWKLLITALYRDGRQADALAAYRRLRQELAAELGLDPSPELRALEQQVLRHDPGLDAGERAARSARARPARSVDAKPRQPARSVQAGVGNLRGLSASLIGRAADLGALTGLVAEHRLVTVVGPAGVGKTRLAIEVARAADAADGAWLVRLEGAHTRAAVWQSVGEAFDLNAATEALALDRLRGFDLLLVLDNGEHVIDLLPETVGRMLSAAPGLRVLATSQLPLKVDGENVYPLQPLTITDSITLFTERATHQRASSTLDADTGQIVEAVCRSLDGLPLAIELAAARVKALSIQEIARRLGDRFALLSDPTSARPPRRRALGAAIAWSYDLLFPDDQRGLWALACFSDGIPLGAVEEVLDALGVPAASAVDVVGRLADRSLVSVEVGAGGAVRYRLLDSVRDFGLDRLREAGLTEVALAAHARWFADAATRAADGTRGQGQAHHLSLVRSERANIDAALAWAGHHDPLLALRIANGFGWAWVVLGAGVEGAQRVYAAVTATESVAAADDRATGLLLAGWLEASGGDLDLATTHIEQAMKIASDELRGVGRLHLSFVRSQQGRPHDVLELLDGCPAAFHRLGRCWEEAGCWLLSAWAQIALGETARAEVACREALRLLVPLGDRWALIHVEAMLGGLAQAEHRFPEAVGHLERAAGAAHELGFGAAEAHHLTNLGRAQQQGGDPQSARATLERAISTARATGDLRTAALARVRLGRVLRVLGDGRAARTIVLSAHRWYLAAGGGDGVGLAEFMIAALDADDGAPDADRRLVEVLDSARRRHDVEVEVLALDRLARLDAERGRASEARALLDTAERVSSSARHLLTDRDRIDHDRALTLLEPSGRQDQAESGP